MTTKRKLTPEIIKHRNKVRRKKEEIKKKLDNTEVLEEYEKYIYLYHQYEEMENNSKNTLKEGLRLSV